MTGKFIINEILKGDAQGGSSDHIKQLHTFTDEATAYKQFLEYQDALADNPHRSWVGYELIKVLATT